MYTTNVIEALNSTLRKDTKRGSLPNQQAIFKILYLRVKELDRKWNGIAKQNWSLVLNQLLVNEKFTNRINKYIKYQSKKEINYRDIFFIMSISLSLTFNRFNQVFCIKN